MEFGSTSATLMLTDYFSRMKIAVFPSDYHHNQSVKGVEIDWLRITMYRILCFITPGTRSLSYQYLFQIKLYLSFISPQYPYSEQGNLWKFNNFILHYKHELGFHDDHFLLTDYLFRVGISGFPSDYHDNQTVKGDGDRSIQISTPSILHSITDIDLIWHQYQFDNSHFYMNRQNVFTAIEIGLFWHYNDVIMGAIASQITSLTIVYSIVYSDADQRKHQSSASLAFVRGIHRGPVNSPHKWPVMREKFPFHDVIMKTPTRTR